MNKSILYKYITSLLLSISLLTGISANPLVSGFDPITFNIGSISGQVGDTVCVDVTVENFVNVEGMQFSINYNSNLLSIICPVDISNSPLDQVALFFNCTDDDGTIRVFWTDPNSIEGDGVSVADGDLVFSLCFVLVGQCGSFTPITLNTYPLPLEISQISDTGISCVNEEIIINEGEISINCSALTIVASKCDADAQGDNSSLTFYVAGGSGDYDYSISPEDFTGTLGESESIQFTNLPIGTYTISVTDNGTGQMITETVMISDNEPLLVTLDATDPFCWNRDKGHIEATVTRFGDEITATYEWSNFRFTQDINNLGNGTYTVTVTDLSGCTATESATLFVDTLRVYAELIDSASCLGNDDAKVKLWAEGGTPFPPAPNPEYNYETSEGDAGPLDTFFLNNVAPGTFYYSAIDAAEPLCIESDTLNIPYKGIDLTLTIDTVNISCFGANDGSATITAMGSTNFGFIVRDESGSLVPGGNTPTQSIANNLTAGCYFVTVTEAFDGCELTGEFCIEEPAELRLEGQVNFPGCVGNDGSISINTIGGTEPYMHMWSDGPTAEDRTGLTGGMYTVTVTDARGCTEIATFDLPDGDDVQIEASVIQAINCPQDENGVIEVNILTGGTFTYNWETADGTFLSDMQTVSNLGSGVYYVTATDDTGLCMALDTAVLAAATPISIEGDFTEPTCPGTPNGSIGIVHIEGTSPFSYVWDDNSTMQVRSGISEGTYAVTITDANLCELDTFLILDAPDKIDIDITDIMGVDCAGSFTGFATATASGGPDMSGLYTYFWSSDPTNGMSGSSVTQPTLPAGENWVIAIDNNCASDTLFFDVPDIDLIDIDLINSTFTPPSCFGECDGSVAIVPFGGNSDSYDLVWLDDNSTSPMRSGLCAGTYELMITDANGCQVTRSFDFVGPELLTVDISLLTEVSCDGDDGKITLSTNGGTEPYMYTWTDNVSTENVATNLGEGTYEIIVTDINGCTAETSYTMIAPEPVIATIGAIAEPECYGDLTCISIVSVSGGIGNDYTFTLNNSQYNYPIDSCVAVYATDGNEGHNIIVTDSSGYCSWETTVYIDQPDQISVDAGPDQEIELGSVSDVIAPIIDSSLPIADITWQPMDSLHCIDSDCEELVSNTLTDILYAIYVTDVNGCSAKDDIFISVNTSRNVYIPNIFTPNGDGTNDYFNLVIGAGAVSVSYLTIYDRWGNRIFALENEYIPEIAMQDGWDGKFNGQPVNPGVYVYMAEVKFLDGVELKYSGDVTVIR